MKRFGRKRLVRPLSVGILGTMIAGAAAIGSSWVNALAVELFVVLLVLGLFALAGTDSDVGAVIGRREDERQKLIEARALALSMKVMYSAAIVCAVIAIALKDNYWQADVIGSCGGLAFLIGLRIFALPDHVDIPPDGDSGV